jgi:hypothetical protein
MANDKELSTFVDVFLGPTLAYVRENIGPFASLRIEARASGFYFYFYDFPRLRQRFGVVADVGISALF